MKHAWLLSTLALWALAVTLPAFAATPAGGAPAATAPADDDDDGDEDEMAKLSKAQPAAPGDRSQTPGAKVYARACAQCHDGQVAKAPSRVFLEMVSPESIYASLKTGIMAPQAMAAGLTDAEKHQVAEFLSGQPVGQARVLPAPMCTGDAAKFDTSRPPAIQGWGFTPENVHFVRGDVAQLPASDVPRLKLKWALAYPSALRVRSRPTFAYGALYTGSQDGTVYALDAKTGCVRWTFRNSAEVRTPVMVQSAADAKGGPPLAFFGDLIGRVHAVNALTGEPVWRVRADDHPSATITGSPVYFRGTLYVPVSSLEEAVIDPNYACCTFRGSVLALDAKTGEQRWKTYMIEEEPKQVGTRRSGAAVMSPSGAAIWNTPSLDPKRGLLYVGTGNNYTGPANHRSNAVIALDLATGKVRWEWQVVPGDAWNVGCMIGSDSCPENPGPDYDIGSGTMLVRLADGTERIMVGLKSGVALAMDPENPTKGGLWQNRVGRGSIQGGIQFGMAFDGERLYVPISDMKDTGDLSSKERDAAAGPIRPGMYALDPKTGKLLWETRADDVCRGRQFCDPGILASIAAIPGAVFAGHMDGRVRAYDTLTGRVLWNFDTTEPMPSLSGAKAIGGSIGGGGPVVYDGMVYVNSGYGLYMHMPGNVLAAFSVDGK
ncbi:MAG: PQQ-binding-like beta-propeller repeat protein [Steroidobacteraceae bacterium]|jgi:polyvinyl alcohol dehydrogenase (cytochrome)|nr:PQQ-binding-like beta-propeller repeat protein [Steroidobacteraceae bacterium]